MTQISTQAGEPFYDVPGYKVETSNDQLSGPWVEVPYLRLESLRIVTAPEIDVCNLSYVYAQQMQQEGDKFEHYPARSLNEKYIRVTINPTSTDPEEKIVWYGVIEIDERSAGGSTSESSTHGTQQIVAYGLLRLLERTPVKTSVLTDDGTEFLTIGRPLGFNVDPHGAYARRGNRSELSHDHQPNGAGSFVFSLSSRSDYTWSAGDAAEYMLAAHAPKSKSGQPIAKWVMRGDKDDLAWFDISLETEGMNVKQVLDKLIDRRRAVTYYPIYDPNENKVEIHTATFVDKNITLPSGATLKANPETKKLDFEQSFDIESAVVRNEVFSRFSKVVAEGEYKTSTLTLRIDNASDEFLKAWSTEDESAYNNATQDAEGYDDLEPAEQYRQNAEFRAQESLSHVWSRFVLSPLWNQQTEHDTGTGVSKFWAAPKIGGDGRTQVEVSVFPDGGEDLRHQSARLLQRLPLLNQYDYSGDKIRDGEFTATTTSDPEYLSPLVWIATKLDQSVLNFGAPIGYTQVDQLNRATTSETQYRKWACSVSILRGVTGLEITVEGGPQHFLAVSNFANPAATDEPHSPDTNGGLDWYNMVATVCMERDSRVQAVAEVLGESPDDPLDRTLYLQIPDARLDYVVPRTVVGVDKLGRFQRTTDGGYVRDDRDRLKDIAEAALQWYGRERQALQMSFKQIRPIVKLGDLITDIGAEYNIAGVNSMVTSIEYNYATDAPTTTFSTQFSELDFLS